MERIVRSLRKLALALIQDRGNRGTLGRNTGRRWRKDQNSPSIINRSHNANHSFYILRHISQLS